VKRLGPVLALAALLAVPALPVLGQGAAEGKWWKRPRIARQLNLAPDQVAELEKIFARAKPKLIDLKAEFEKKRFDYDQAMQSDDVTREQLESKIEAREQARTALQKELAIMELDMKKVLNPEQREKLVAMRERARALVQERRRRMRDSDVDSDFGETDAAPPAQRDKRVVTPKRDR
jgi:Spy/CpxP family protein refolding chaperone